MSNITFQIGSSAPSDIELRRNPAMCQSQGYNRAIWQGLNFTSSSVQAPTTWQFLFLLVFSPFNCPCVLHYSPIFFPTMRYIFHSPPPQALKVYIWARQTWVYRAYSLQRNIRTNDLSTPLLLCWKNCHKSQPDYLVQSTWGEHLSESFHGSSIHDEGWVKG